jgi:hypothetical protein
MAQTKQKPATYLASNKIKLTESEVRICQWLAKQRHSSNRSGGVVDGKIGPQSCEETDLEGICGEFAFCKALNLFLQSIPITAIRKISELPFLIEISFIVALFNPP